MYAAVVPQGSVDGQAAAVGGSDDSGTPAHDLSACVDGHRDTCPVRADQRSEIHDPALGGPAEPMSQEGVVLSKPDHEVALITGRRVCATTRVGGAELAEVPEPSARAPEERNREA